ncbi:MAG: TetR/AcrR family transcriptional regulator [Chloroflexi bacterium]|nr:TetR/AcrR family transcriptional regulator [Chloroflexota bacterium]
MSPKVSEQHMEERRNQILDAAVTLYSRNGFHQTTIEDISLEAGLSRGAVYHYFKAKQDITDGIRQRSAQQADALLTGTLENEGSMGRLLALIDSSFAMAASPDSVDANRLAIMLWAEALVNKSIMDSQLPTFSPYLNALTELVGRAQKDHAINSDLEPHSIARIVSAVMIGLLVQLTWEPDIDMDEAKNSLVAMLTGNIRSGNPL